MYKVYAYTGLVWSKDLGLFDSFDEAQDALCVEYYRQADDNTSPDDFKAFEESFWACSGIIKQ